MVLCLYSVVSWFLLNFSDWASCPFVFFCLWSVLHLYFFWLYKLNLILFTLSFLFAFDEQLLRHRGGSWGNTTLVISTGFSESSSGPFPDEMAAKVVLHMYVCVEILVADCRFVEILRGILNMICMSALRQRKRRRKMKKKQRQNEFHFLWKNCLLRRKPKSKLWARSNKCHLLLKLVCKLWFADVCFIFLVLAHPVSLEQRAIKRVFFCFLMVCRWLVPKKTLLILSSDHKWACSFQ